MARRYNRDRRGRFAAKGATARGGRLTTASGRRYKTQVKEITGGAPKGTMSRRRNAHQPTQPASNIRLTNGLKRPKPANKIVSSGRGPRGSKIVAYKPTTESGIMDKAARSIREKIVKPYAKAKPKIDKLLNESNKLQTGMARDQARAMADRVNPKASGFRKRMSGIQIKTGMNREGRKVIQRRGQRAAAAAARGSKPAQRALRIYDQQLASMTPAKGAAKASNNIQPGRNNPRKPKPKRKRR